MKDTERRAAAKAFMRAYGFWGKLNTESECVAELMKMLRYYRNLFLSYIAG